MKKAAKEKVAAEKIAIDKAAKKKAAKEKAAINKAAKEKTVKEKAVKEMEKVIVMDKAAPFNYFNKGMPLIIHSSLLNAFNKGNNNINIFNLTLSGNNKLGYNA